MAITNPHALENFLSSGWRGYFSLWEMFWRYYLVGRVIALAIAGILVVTMGFLGWFLGFLVWVPYWVWSLAALWRCAPNTPWPFLALVARVWVYVEVVSAVFLIDKLTLVEW